MRENPQVMLLFDGIFCSHAGRQKSLIRGELGLDGSKNPCAAYGLYK